MEIQRAPCRKPSHGDDDAHEKNTESLVANIKQFNAEKMSTPLLNHADLCQDCPSGANKLYHDNIYKSYEWWVEIVTNHPQLSALGRHLLLSNISLFYNQYLTVAKHMYGDEESRKLIESQKINKPIFICALPRTGSTLLFNLLGCDENARLPLFTDMWPAGDVTRPLSRTQTEQHNKRRAAQRLEEEVKMIDNALIPYRASHPKMEYEEDLLIMNYTGFFNYFFLTVPTTTLQLSGKEIANASSTHDSMLRYNDDNNDKDFIYAFHRSFLKMLNTVDPPKSHWVLKSPEHTLFPKTLLQHYDESSPSVIMLHRDMTEVLPSYAYLCAAKTYYLYERDECKLITIGTQVMEMIDTMLANITKFRQNNDKVRVFDLKYEDLTQDPIGCVKQIYEYFGYHYSTEFEDAMRKWLIDNPQGNQGRNVYSMEMFGYSVDNIKKRYEAYMKQYLGK